MLDLPTPPTQLPMPAELALPAGEDQVSLQRAPQRTRFLSIIVPAHDEAQELPFTIDSLLASDPPHLPVELVVVSNGSRDGTAEVARRLAGAVERKGWSLIVLELSEGNKAKALTAGDRAATGDIRIYADADVRVSPRLLAELARVLDRPEPAYASGQPAPLRSRSQLTQAYTRLWLRVPFMANGVPGCGVFAMNKAGRSRWTEWPDIISDDTFARLQFAPGDRHLVQEPYGFPMPEGLSRLIRVRKRQNHGVQQFATRFPELLRNDDKPPLGPGTAVALAFRDPIGFLSYFGVSLAVRFAKWDGTWSRGR